MDKKRIIRYNKRLMGIRYKNVDCVDNVDKKYVYNYKYT